ncbi:MAG TPA: ABC transporter transmembrane domain-containing protein, partial [Candidatus Paceibacterota bacterium]|nr:ABC transporter transmembrane domain-containing protein [Candidatus Paceibacterota bacterium]
MEPNDFLLSSPKKIFFYGIKPYRFRVFCMYTSVIAGFVCGYSLPYFLKVIADKISTTHQIAYSLSDFYTPLFCIFLILVGQELFFRIGHILETFITVRVFDRVTTKIYKTLINRPTAFFEQTFSGELNRYLEQIGSGVKFFIDFFPWEIGWIVVAPLVTIVLLAQANMWLVLVFIVWFLLFVLVSFFSLRWIYRQSKNISESYGELSGAVVDVFANTSIVHGFAAYDYEYMRYRGYMDAVISAERRERKIEIFNKFQQGISVLLLVLSLVTTGIFLFIKNLITVGDFLIIAAIIPTFIDIVRSGGDVVIKAVHNYADFKNAIA